MIRYTTDDGEDLVVVYGGMLYGYTRGTRDHLYCGTSIEDLATALERDPEDIHNLLMGDGVDDFA